MRPPVRAWLAAALVLPGLSAPGCRESGDGATEAIAPPGGQLARTVTYSRDIAPIVFERCASCHRPEGSAPFSLLTYTEVRKRASQIAEVTASRFMPPWLPEPGHGTFVGERRLGDEQIAIFQRWAQDGAVEGDRTDLPDPPQWTKGWERGTPDLVVTMSEPFALPAEGTDVFRNFVLPAHLATTRYVNGIELHPGNKKLVHHAIVMTDPSRRSRRLDEADPEPGYPGMDAVYGLAPDGHFLGWTPGAQPVLEPDPRPWRLDPGTDFLVQLHMVPSGKPESIQPAIGLYFGEPPRDTARTFTLYLKAPVDIPAGDSDYTVVDRFVLPVAATVEHVYPHAHYLGKSMEAFATLPDGSTRWLISIPEWDFNWQDSYRYATPMELPRNTTITMRWTYDNSSANVRNPNQPPARVVSGNRTTDEMAHLYLQLQVAGEPEETALKIAEAEHRLAQTPGDWMLRTTLAAVLQVAGRFDEAIDHCLAALQHKPDHGPARYCLALVYERQGRLDEAIDQYRQAVAAEPDDPLLRISLAEALVAAGRLADAELQAQRAIQIDPAIGDAYTVLGNVSRFQSRFPEAVEHYRRAIAIRGDDVRPHTYLAVIRTQEGRFDEAAVHLTDALAILPDSAALHSSLGRVLLAKGDTPQAIEHFRRALAIDPNHAEARHHLQAALRTD